MFSFIGVAVVTVLLKALVLPLLLLVFFVLVLRLLILLLHLSLYTFYRPVDVQDVNRGKKLTLVYVLVSLIGFTYGRHLATDIRYPFTFGTFSFSPTFSG